MSFAYTKSRVSSGGREGAECGPRARHQVVYYLHMHEVGVREISLLWWRLQDMYMYVYL